MKITKSQLKQIIKEEIKSTQLLNEWALPYIVHVNEFAEQVFKSNQQFFMDVNSNFFEDLADFTRYYKRFSDTEYEMEPEEIKVTKERMENYRESMLETPLKAALEEAGKQDLWKKYTEMFITGELGASGKDPDTGEPYRPFPKMVGYFFEQLYKMVLDAEKKELSKRTTADAYYEFVETFQEEVEYHFLDDIDDPAVEEVIGISAQRLLEGIKTALVLGEARGPDAAIGQLNLYAENIERLIKDIEDGKAVPEFDTEPKIDSWQQEEEVLDYLDTELKYINQLINDIEEGQVVFDGSLSRNLKSQRPQGRTRYRSAAPPSRGNPGQPPGEIYEMVKQELAKLLKERTK